MLVTRYDGRLGAALAIPALPALPESSDSGSAREAAAQRWHSLCGFGARGQGCPAGASVGPLASLRARNASLLCGGVCSRTLLALRLVRLCENGEPMAQFNRNQRRRKGYHSTRGDQAQPSARKSYCQAENCRSQRCLAEKFERVEQTQARGQLKLGQSVDDVCHRSHFGSRYTLGCCDLAGLFILFNSIGHVRTSKKRMRAAGGI